MGIIWANIGDRLLIHAAGLDEPPRDGEILDVLGPDGAPPFVVRWDDGRVSRLYPGRDASVLHVGPDGQ